MMNFNEFINEESLESRSAAGVAIIYNNKILLVHPTGASWQKGTCGIPKGGIDPHEDTLDAALRELKEETGITLDPSALDKSPEVVVSQHPKKNKLRHLTYYICRISDLSKIGLTSERVPKDQLQLEEIDWAKFMSAEEAYPIMAQSQLIILDRHLTLNK